MAQTNEHDKDVIGVWQPPRHNFFFPSFLDLYFVLAMRSFILPLVVALLMSSASAFVARASSYPYVSSETYISRRRRRH